MRYLEDSTGLSKCQLKTCSKVERIPDQLILSAPRFTVSTNAHICVAPFFSWTLSKLLKPLSEKSWNVYIYLRLLRFLLFLVYLEMVSCSPGWPQINCTAQDGLEPLIRLTPPPKRRITGVSCSVLSVYGNRLRLNSGGPLWLNFKVTLESSIRSLPRGAHLCFALYS